MVNTQKLNEAINREGFTKTHLAAVLGISRQSLSNKINNKVGFRAQEGAVLKNKLRLTDTDFVAIFFAPECGCEPHNEEV